jgi:hypothetical protein
MKVIKVVDVPKNLEIDFSNSRSDPRVNNFGCMLFRLIFKADSNNLARLKKCFPLEVTAFEKWRDSTEDIFPTEVAIEEEQ